MSAGLNAPRITVSAWNKSDCPAAESQIVSANGICSSMRASADDSNPETIALPKLKHATTRSLG